MAGILAIEGSHGGRYVGHPQRMCWTSTRAARGIAVEDPVMTDKPIELDARRGMAAQHATDLRRMAAEVEADRAGLRRRQDELEQRLLAHPAENWSQAADKARYLLGLFDAASGRGDARLKSLIDAVLADFDRLAGHP
jgi:hypothetical protein